MTMKGKPDIYPDKLENEINRNKIPDDDQSGDGASSVTTQDADGFSSPARAASVTDSDIELKSSNGSSTDMDLNTFEGLIKLCGEAGPWQLQVNIDNI